MQGEINNKVSLNETPITSDSLLNSEAIDKYRASVK